MAWDKGNVIGWKLIAIGKKQLGYKVYEKQLDKRKFTTFEVGMPFEFKGKDGEIKKMIDSNIPMYYLKDYVALLHEVDQKFNEGKAFAQFVNQGTSEPNSDDVPW